MPGRSIPKAIGLIDWGIRNKTTVRRSPTDLATRATRSRKEQLAILPRRKRNASKRI
jgi:hypothetical protein